MSPDDRWLVDRLMSADDRWLVDPLSGKCIAEQPLCDVPLEFPTLDPRLQGRDARFAFAIRPSTVGGPNR
jgi:carotenoid cleavage dioxygenase-like enzyme